MGSWSQRQRLSWMQLARHSRHFLHVRASLGTDTAGPGGHLPRQHLHWQGPGGAGGEEKSAGRQPLPAPSQNAAGERAFLGLWSQAKLVWPSPAKTYTGRILCVLNACFTQTPLFFPVDENLAVKTTASLKHSEVPIYITLDLLSRFFFVLPEPLYVKYFNCYFFCNFFLSCSVKRNNSLHTRFIGET